MCCQDCCICDLPEDGGCFCDDCDPAGPNFFFNLCCEASDDSESFSTPCLNCGSRIGAHGEGEFERCARIYHAKRLRYNLISGFEIGNDGGGKIRCSHSLIDDESAQAWGDECSDMSDVQFLQLATNIIQSASKEMGLNEVRLKLNLFDLDPDANYSPQDISEFFRANASRDLDGYITDELDVYESLVVRMRLFILIARVKIAHGRTKVNLHENRVLEVESILNRWLDFSGKVVLAEDGPADALQENTEILIERLRADREKVVEE